VKRREWRISACISTKPASWKFTPLEQHITPSFISAFDNKSPTEMHFLTQDEYFSNGVKELIFDRLFRFW
jgi:hypothetical protein